MTNAVAITSHKPPISVSEHFTHAADLYHVWSPAGHLHFGFWKKGLNPFVRHGMLAEMVEQVYNELRITAPVDAKLADLGCGYGSAAMQLASGKNTSIDAYTIIRSQVEEGNRRVDNLGLGNLVNLFKRDFRRTEAKDNLYDGAYALESLCYASGNHKSDVLQEIHRILKPGSRLCLTDGFIIERIPSKGIRRMILNKVTKGWAVEQFAQRDAFVESLRSLGFEDIKVKDLSLRVAPSVLHAPPLIVKSVIDRIIEKRPIDPMERAHLASCFWGLALGLFRRHFRYLMVSATKAH